MLPSLVFPLLSPFAHAHSRPRNQRRSLHPSPPKRYVGGMCSWEQRHRTKTSDGDMFCVRCSPPYIRVFVAADASPHVRGTLLASFLSSHALSAQMLLSCPTGHHPRCGVLHSCFRPSQPPCQPHCPVQRRPLHLPKSPCLLPRTFRRRCPLRAPHQGLRPSPSPPRPRSPPRCRFLRPHQNPLQLRP